MTDSLSKLNEELTETQKKLETALTMTKDFPSKINKLLEEKKVLKAQNDELRQINSDIKNKIVILENKLTDQQNEFETKNTSNENRIVSLERELDLSKEEIDKHSKTIEEKVKRIEVLEAQKEELTQSLREKSSE
ncbi:MAG: hypothetical protein ACW97X_02625 [Candidatus Hodarchaeales archaeon]|jgi:chromosome segregation ATPase